MTTEELATLKKKIDKIKENNIIAENKKRELEQKMKELGFNNKEELEVELTKKLKEKEELEAKILEKEELIDAQIRNNTCD